MNRREAIYGLSVITGMALAGASSLLSSYTYAFREFLNDEDVQLFNEIGEIIIPATPDSPGAKTANIGEYIRIMIQDCTSNDDRIRFMKGWQQVQLLGKAKYHQNKLLALTDQEKMIYLTELDKHTFTSDNKSEAGLAIAAFAKIKQLTLKGYFTSETGATKALRFDPVPGNFIGMIPYKKGDKVWASSM
jgi:hypothetical protein